MALPLKISGQDKAWRDLSQRNGAWAMDSLVWMVTT
jgi:hypothetical protein